MGFAGRVATGAGPEEAWRVARRVEATLRTAPDGVFWDADRHGLLRRAWSLLDEIRPERLGPEAGRDLCLLFVAEDGGGVGVAGVGLGAVWGRFDDTFRALVPLGHPLLGLAGRPLAVPGVLTLERRPQLVVAAPAGAEPVLPDASSFARRCGDRP